MGYKIIQPPASLPMDASAMAERCGLDIDSGVSIVSLEALIKSATQWAEQYTGRALVTRTVELALDAFCAQPVELPFSPVSTIVSVKYTDAGGIEQTVSPAVYTLDDYAYVNRIMLAYGEAWPSSRVQPNAVRIRYLAGYGTTGDIPADILNAIVLIVAQSYRGQSGIEANLYPATIPNAARDLLAPYRLYGF